MNSPLVSVIMPFYNCEKYIDDSISSILNQTFSDFEFIVINDASTDKSDEIVQEYMKVDGRIIYIKNKKNRGSTYNFNNGIALAKGKYIAIMDGDDISTLDRLEKQTKILIEDKSIDIVGGFMKMVSEDGKTELGNIVKPISSEEISRNAFLYQTVNHGTMVCKKEIFTALGGYREKYKEFQDTDLIIRMLFSGYKCVNIPEYMYYYRIHSNNSIADLNIKKAYKYLKFQKEIIKTYNYTPSIKEYTIMYGYLLARCILPGHFLKKIEGICKKLLLKKY